MVPESRRPPRRIGQGRGWRTPAGFRRFRRFALVSARDHSLRCSDRFVMNATGMTAVCSRLPAKVYMVGRRTERRVHLFRPDPLMNKVFLYCLAVAARKTKVSVMAAALMSNHYHAVVVDHDGRISEFTERFHLLLTKATQVYRGWIGKVFDSAKPSYVELLTPAAIIDKCGYTLANRPLRGWCAIRRIGRGCGRG